MAGDRTPTPRAVRSALDALSEHVVNWRKLRGLTTAQVAERAGVARTTISRLENDPGAVSLENVVRVARALGILDLLVQSIDPMATDIGRLRAEERLPERVRPRRLDGAS